MWWFRYMLTKAFKYMLTKAFKYMLTKDLSLISNIVTQNKASNYHEVLRLWQNEAVVDKEINRFSTCVPLVCRLPRPIKTQWEALLLWAMAAWWFWKEVIKWDLLLCNHCWGYPGTLSCSQVSESILSWDTHKWNLQMLQLQRSFVNLT